MDHGIIATASREPLMNANDHVPMGNIMPFGFCKKGMPCMPLTPLAWVDVNKKHIIDGAPALTEDSKLACFHGGVISIVPLNAGSAEEGDRNDDAEDVVEEIAMEALGLLGSIVAKRIPFVKNLVKMSGKKKSAKGGGNKGKESGGGESKKTGSSNTEKVYDAAGDPNLRATRRPTYDKWVKDGIEVNGQNFKMNQHAENSLFKSGRKDIMPDDIKDALATKPKPAQPGSVEYVNPSTGTTVFVNPETKEIVGVWPSSFMK